MDIGTRGQTLMPRRVGDYNRFDALFIGPIHSLPAIAFSVHHVKKRHMLPIGSQKDTFTPLESYWFPMNVFFDHKGFDVALQLVLRRG
jgi:hypothetical protein